MEWFSTVDWEPLFTPDKPLLEIIIRGSVIYLALLFLLRLMKRQTGSLGMTDILLLVLLADAAQNAMAGEYHSLPDGIVLVSTLVFWNFSLDWLSYKFAFVEKLLHPPPVPLVKNGRFIRKNMNHELVSEDDLMSRLREEGVSSVHEVKHAYMEGDGKISVVKKSGQ
jgi:uncharacterized membrane protein YcaP (DUF421 family)